MARVSWVDVVIVTSRSGWMITFFYGYSRGTLGVRLIWAPPKCIYRVDYQYSSSPRSIVAQTASGWQSVDGLADRIFVQRHDLFPPGLKLNSRLTSPFTTLAAVLSIRTAFALPLILLRREYQLAAVTTRQRIELRAGQGNK